MRTRCHAGPRRVEPPTRPLKARNKGPPSTANFPLKDLLPDRYARCARNNSTPLAIKITEFTAVSSTANVADPEVPNLLTAFDFTIKNAEMRPMKSMNSANRNSPMPKTLLAMSGFVRNKLKIGGVDWTTGIDHQNGAAQLSSVEFTLFEVAM